MKFIFWIKAFVVYYITDKTPDFAEMDTTTKFFKVIFAIHHRTTAKFILKSYNVGKENLFRWRCTFIYMLPVCVCACQCVCVHVCRFIAIVLYPISVKLCIF